MEILPQSGRLIRVHPKLGRAPLVMCHAIAGTVFFYYHLQRSGLLQGPLLAMQASGLEDGEQPLDSVEELASRNIAMIEREMDVEAVHIGGYSFGCVVAQEMARQLEAAGRWPRKLILLAPSPPTTLTKHTSLEDRSSLIEAQAQLLLKQALRGMDRIVPRRYKDRLSNVYRSHLGAYHGHVPAPVRSEIAAFLPLGERAEARASIASHWRPLSQTNCTFHDVDGDHKTMIRRPYVLRLVPFIEAQLHETGAPPRRLVEPGPIRVLPRRHSTPATPAVEHPCES